MYGERPYRLILPAIAAVLMTALGAGARPLQAAVVHVNVVPAKTDVLVGQQVDVTITANISENILGFGFDLLFNEQLLGIASVKIASPFVPLTAPDGDGLAGLAYPNNVVGSNVQLAIVTLNALAPGKSSLGIGITPGDPMEGFPEYQGWADLQTTEGTVTIRVADSLASGGLGGGGGGLPEIVSPEPGTITLIALGAILARKSSRRCLR